MRKVLEILQDGEFHSGEDIGRVLGISRAAIWKRLNSLRGDLGLDIHSVRGRGYRLSSPVSLLDRQRLSAGISHLGWQAALLESVDSTNAEVLRRLSAGNDGPLLVVAEQQISGRGRRGRVWASPYGENLYFSLGFHHEGGAQLLEGLSLTVGLAVLRALEGAGCIGAGLKWPNDLLVNGQKIAGILIELSGDPAGSCQVVVGIGVNVNMTATRCDSISQPWTSLRSCLGRLLERTDFALSLAKHLHGYLKHHESEGFPSIRAEWEASHLWQGAEVSLQMGARAIDGVILGVDDQGALRLLVDGSEQRFSGGELSLRLRNDS
ncbi:bifunctional biotin--[acetyl-CoA-carboxylase] ligase/biotin operon repressor BirA [Pseudomonas sp. LRF_L74]|uniref:bifunctional biotin--[acetyl-CoA-carboxylase] ligase/biotin operon repressor BirA n=1 Tax=Pseudomonas sp. LRF_L74 TaxID=3369422 RepID=UPI003F5E55F3